MTAATQQAATAPLGPTGKLATWVAELSLSDVPAAVVERAKHLLLDGIGCALIGAQLPWSRTATEAVLDIDGRGDTVVIGTGRTASAPAAAVLNGTLHSGFRARRLPSDRAATQLLAADPRAAVHRVVAAANPRRRSAAGRDRRVRGRATRRLHAAWRRNARPRLAFRIGLRHPLGGDGLRQAAWPVPRSAGGRTRPGGHPVVRPDGRPVRGDEQAHAPRPCGPQRALRSRASPRTATPESSGCSNANTADSSVFSAKATTPTPTRSRVELGDRWETSTIMVKSYAAMGGLHGAIDAARRLRSSVDPKRIAHIDITVGTTIYKHGWWAAERPLTPIGAQMHLGYATAAALLDGNVLPEQFTPTRLDAEDIWRLSNAPTSTSTRAATGRPSPSATAPTSPSPSMTARCIGYMSTNRTAHPPIRSPTTNSSPSSTRWPTGSRHATVQPPSNTPSLASTTSPTSTNSSTLLAAPVAGALD